MANYYFYPGKKKSLLSKFSMNTTLIGVNVLFFIVIIIFGAFIPNILEYIALKPANIFGGKFIWTFVTSMFMHGGIFHLLINMLSLFFVGSLIEKILGSKRYLYFYLGSGLFAGIFFVVLSVITGSADFNAFAVGASGAIFGLIGLLMILTPNLPVYLFFIPIPIKMKYAAPGMLILLWLISKAASLSVGNTAHLGGLVAGIFFGIYLKRKYKNKTQMISKIFS